MIHFQHQRLTFEGSHCWLRNFLIHSQDNLVRNANSAGGVTEPETSSISCEYNITGSHAVKVTHELRNKSGEKSFSSYENGPSGSEIRESQIANEKCDISIHFQTFLLYKFESKSRPRCPTSIKNWCICSESFGKYWIWISQRRKNICYVQWLDFYNRDKFFRFRYPMFITLLLFFWSCKAQ